MTRLKKLKLSLSKVKDSIHYLPFQYGLKIVFGVIALLVISLVFTSDTETDSNDISMWKYIGVIAVMITLIVLISWLILRLSGLGNAKSKSNTNSSNKFTWTIPSWLKGGFSKISGFIGFIVGAGLAMYLLMCAYGYGVKKIHDITGNGSEKSSQVSVSTWESKKLKFDSEENAKYVLVAPAGYRITSDAFPANGIIITDDGSRYRVGPDYGYKIPDMKNNIHWKCVSMGNPFEVTVYTSKK